MAWAAVARQFGNPQGLLGRLVGGIMVRGNGDLNAWVARALVERRDPRTVTRVLELGSGPGVGLACLLDAFPGARVWGVDQSSTMLQQAQRRNSSSVQAGRLQLVHGDASAAAAMAPLDLIVAVHVLYFWRDPVRELSTLRAALATDGLLALGFQLRPHMPALAQREFPRAGHRLYDSDDEVRRVLDEAGLTEVDIIIKGSDDAPHGRLVLAHPASAAK